MPVEHEEAHKQVINLFLVKAFNQILALEEKWLRDQGLIDITLTEVHLIDAIAQRDNPAMGDVAARASLTNGTITTTVKKLEKKDYVMRKRDELDRRIIRVRLTERGEAALSAHQAFHDMMVNLLYDHATADENLILIRTLSDLTNFFSTLTLGEEYNE